MLAPILKKLIFVRKFKIVDGAINVLNSSQVMLPSSFIDKLDQKSSSLLAKELSENLSQFTKNNDINLILQFSDIIGVGKISLSSKKPITFQIKNPCKNTNLLQELILNISNKCLGTKEVSSIKESKSLVTVTLK